MGELKEKKELRTGFTSEEQQNLDAFELNCNAINRHHPNSTHNTLNFCVTTMSNLIMLAFLYEML